MALVMGLHCLPRVAKRDMSSNPLVSPRERNDCPPVGSPRPAGGPFVARGEANLSRRIDKREMMPWDYWGIARNMKPGIQLDNPTLERIDNLSALIEDPDSDWKAIRETYDREDSFRVPQVVLSYPKGIAIEVRVGK